MNYLLHSHNLHEGHIHDSGVSLLSVLEHSLLDTLPMIPILLVTFILIEYMEHKFSKNLQSKVKNAGILGPIFGALIGMIPQCGFSVMAVALYSKKIISLGTMISIFIATSDEALPVFLSVPSAYDSILPFMIVKIIIAILAGYIIDLIIVKRKNSESFLQSDDINEKANKCVDKKSVSFYKVFMHSLERTFKVSIYIYAITFIITFVIEYFGVEVLTGGILNSGYVSVFIASLIGLIPNCAISVGLVKLYTVGAISFASVIAGLSSNAGLALIYLFKESKDKKKAVLITLLLLGISFISGVIIEALGIYS